METVDSIQYIAVSENTIQFEVSVMYQISIGY